MSNVKCQKHLWAAPYVETREFGGGAQIVSLYTSGGDLS